MMINKELTKAEFCKNALRALRLPNKEHLYAIAGLVELFDDI